MPIKLEISQAEKVKIWLDAQAVTKNFL
jgi:hypothetical protein